MADLPCAKQDPDTNVMARLHGGGVPTEQLHKQESSVLVSSVRNLDYRVSPSLGVTSCHTLDCCGVLCMVRGTCTQQLHSTERTDR